MAPVLGSCDQMILVLWYRFWPLGVVALVHHMLKVDSPWVVVVPSPPTYTGSLLAPSAALTKPVSSPEADGGKSSLSPALKSRSQLGSWMMRNSGEVGVAEGAAEGTVEGVSEGVADGVAEGAPAGVPVGGPAGVVDGAPAGVSEGVADGVPAGVAEGVSEGVAEGVPAGDAEGVPAGEADGMAGGTADGVAEGVAEGVGTPLLQAVPRFA